MPESSTRSLIIEGLSVAEELEAMHDSGPRQDARLLRNLVTAIVVRENTQRDKDRLQAILDTIAIAVQGYYDGVDAEDTLKEIKSLLEK